MLRVCDVTKSYDGVNIILNNINMYAKKGEIVGIVGLNGAGKSTLMKTIAGVTDVSSGHVLINGADNKLLSEYQRKKISFLSTGYNLYNELTVIENLNIFKKIYVASDEELKHVVSLLKIESFLNKKVGDLSTGMKKRVEIACSTMHKFNLLMLDEPTNGLDIEAKEQILDYFRSRLTPNNAILITSHNIKDIEKLCKRIYVIREGKIIIDTTIEELLQRNSNKGKVDLEDAILNVIYEGDYRE